MRAWQVILVLLLLVPLLDAQKNKKGGKNNKNNKNKDVSSRQDDQDDHDDEEGPQNMEDDSRDDSSDDSREKEQDNSREKEEDDSGENELPLPRNTMLTEDNDVDVDGMYQMFSGDANCKVSCKGSVSGMTTLDPRYPYYRYINVDITNCFKDDLVFPPDFAPRHHDFEQWNATVTKLQFYRIKDPNVHQIPKRLSRPTEVESTRRYCSDEEGCQPTKRHFGFVVFIPRFDMQVKWKVDWEVHARNPYINMDEDNQGYWNYGDCDGVVEEYMEDTRYQNKAFSINQDRGYSFWRSVEEHDEQ